MRRILTVIATIFALLASLLAMAGGAVAQTVPRIGPDANHALRVSDGTALSTNWSGYALLGKFHEVKGTFTIPPCYGAGFGSEWVGIDGYNNDDLIQAGVSEVDAPGDGCQYSAWWEILPASSVSINWMNVRPGDQIRVSVTHLPPDMNGGIGPWAWSVSILDLATGQEFDQIFNYNGPAKSAEWIVEAPQVDGNVGDIVPYQEVTWSDLGADGRAAALENVWLVQDGREHSITSTVNTTKQLMRDGFAVAYVG